MKSKVPPSPAELESASEHYLGPAVCSSETEKNLEGGEGRVSLGPRVPG